MTFHPEAQLISSRHDKVAKTFHYKIRAAGRVWDVAIPERELEACGPVEGADAALNQQKRREHLARRLAEVMAHG